MKIAKIEDIEVYKDSLLLTKEVFDLCKEILLRREFSLCEQLKRAAISICANIAEGFGRKTSQDFAQFLSIALGSCNEVIAILDVIILNFNLKEAFVIKNKYYILSKRIYSLRRSLLR